ncbi:MAG: RsmD family RNA methyltransferase, partial [Thermoanaerobaculia bacterium]|nr:RsmD family RNA methyltransferase [Thermoanaerobaculia bacterium]
LAAAGERFDLVFADPPYAWTPTVAFVADVAQLLGPGGALALEHSARVAVPEAGGNLIKVDTRRYGESALSLYRSA